MLSASPQEQSVFWDSHWSKIICPGGEYKNAEKMAYLLEELSNRAFYSTAKVLDIGCGTGIHAHYLMQTVWPSLDWTGIDLSQVAVASAQQGGLKAINKSLYDMDGEFTAFWFLDVLEHIDDHDKAAEAVRRMAKKPFRIFGNIPLYRAVDPTTRSCELAMDVNVLGKFLVKCGADKFWQQIYGVRGYPYMIFEAV